MNRTDLLIKDAENIIAMWKDPEHYGDEDSDGTRGWPGYFTVAVGQLRDFMLITKKLQDCIQEVLDAPVSQPDDRGLVEKQISVDLIVKMKEAMAGNVIPQTKGEKLLLLRTSDTEVFCRLCKRWMPVARGLFPRHHRGTKKCSNSGKDVINSDIRKET